jgi:serine/threonine protein kinase
MAELFLARTNGPEGFEKLVVLKKILPNFAENPKFVRLFLDEAKLAATLDHPHIAHVYDMGKVDGNYFFTMEYIHGQDVRATLRRTARLDQKLPIDHAVQIGHATASALHYAHERRKPDGSLLDIVHRDVSPSNILISYDGAIKLVDFGVAKAATSSVKTRTGTLKGKIAYMSPEQAKGGMVDRRSDVFSLGIVLWETITTQRLFKGDNDLATIQLIINSKPQPPRELRPEISPELERIILKALATDPETRYQTAEELQLDLEELTREEKLKQSSIALRAHMQDLFADEIRAWKSAQASGVTLTDHVVSASVVEMTTPVSENELSFLDDDDDDDGSRPQVTEGMITETRQQAAQAATVELQISKVVVASSPNIVVGRLDQTTPPPAAPVAPMVMSASGRMPAFTPSHAVQPRPQTIPPPIPIGHQPSGPMRIPQDSGPVMIASTSFVREPTAFPIAPREWRAEAKQAIGQDASEPKRRRLIIASLIGVAVLALIALATGGTEPPVSTAAQIRPVVETGPVNMQVEPPEKATVPATAPAVGSATAGSATAPASSGSATAPAATGSDAEPTPRPTTSTLPSTTTTSHPHPTTTPRPTTTVPTAHPPATTTPPHHTAATTVPKTDPKTHPKDVNPPTHRYDPNSALPPP